MSPWCREVTKSLPSLMKSAHLESIKGRGCNTTHLAIELHFLTRNLHLIILPPFIYHLFHQHQFLICLLFWPSSGTGSTPSKLTLIQHYLQRFFIAYFTCTRFTERFSSTTSQPSTSSTGQPLNHHTGILLITHLLVRKRRHVHLMLVGTNGRWEISSDKQKCILAQIGRLTQCEADGVVYWRIKW